MSSTELISATVENLFAALTRFDDPRWSPLEEYFNRRRPEGVARNPTVSSDTLNAHLGLGTRRVPLDASTLTHVIQNRELSADQRAHLVAFERRQGPLAALVRYQSLSRDDVAQLARRPMGHSAARYVAMHPLRYAMEPTDQLIADVLEWAAPKIRVQMLAEASRGLLDDRATRWIKEYLEDSRAVRYPEDVTATLVRLLRRRRDLAECVIAFAGDPRVAIVLASSDLVRDAATQRVMAHLPAPGTSPTVSSDHGNRGWWYPFSDTVGAEIVCVMVASPYTHPEVVDELVTRTQCAPDSYRLRMDGRLAPRLTQRARFEPYVSVPLALPASDPSLGVAAQSWIVSWEVTNHRSQVDSFRWTLGTTVLANPNFLSPPDTPSLRGYHRSSIGAHSQLRREPSSYRIGTDVAADSSGPTPAEHRAVRAAAPTRLVVGVRLLSGDGRIYTPAVPPPRVVATILEELGDSPALVSVFIALCEGWTSTVGDLIDTVRALN